MFYVYKKSTGEVKMVSKDKPTIDTKIFGYVEKNDDDFEGKKMLYNDGNIEKSNIDKSIDVQEEIANAETIDDIKAILSKLLIK